MINKLIVEKHELINKSRYLRDHFHILDIFINNVEGLFMKEESIMALGRIKEYFNYLNEELECVASRGKEVQDEINKNCKHEILCHNGYCTICDNNFSESEINFECLIVEGHEYNTRSQIKDIILDIAKRNGNIRLEFEDIVFENHENILVRRKTR